MRPPARLRGVSKPKAELVVRLDDFYNSRLAAEEDFGPAKFFSKAELVSVGPSLGLTTIEGLVPENVEDLEDGPEVRCRDPRLALCGRRASGATKRRLSCSSADPSPAAAARQAVRPHRQGKGRPRAASAEADALVAAGHVCWRYLWPRHGQRGGRARL